MPQLETIRGRDSRGVEVERDVALAAENKCEMPATSDGVKLAEGQIWQSNQSLAGSLQLSRRFFVTQLCCCPAAPSRRASAFGAVRANA